MSDTPFRSGYIAVVGWPNVGKSTFVNALLGVKLSIVTPKPQTTRESILGILNEPNVQIIFVDTPGWLKPTDPFQAFMKKNVLRTVFDDADVLLWLVEPRRPSDEEWTFAEVLAKANKPLVVAVNKSDTTSPETTNAVATSYRERLGPQTRVHVISAKTGSNVSALKDDLRNRLPEGQPYFPTDQITDRWERFYVAELIRERIFHMYQQEVPHAAAVVVEEFAEREGRKDHIKVNVFVETEGQKRIVIGQGGRLIKTLSQSSREEIESRLGRSIYLELVVKVKKNWRKDEQFLKSLQDGVPN